MSKILLYTLFATSIAASAVASVNPDRFPALETLPVKPRAAVATLMDWQRTLVDLTPAEIEAKFGKPDKTKIVGTNTASGKPMQMICYRLSRRSELQITIHEGEVVAVAAILMPSGNENGPIED